MSTLYSASNLLRLKPTPSMPLHRSLNRLHPMDVASFSSITTRPCGAPSTATSRKHLFPAATSSCDHATSGAQSTEDVASSASCLRSTCCSTRPAAQGTVRVLRHCVLLCLSTQGEQRACFADENARTMVLITDNAANPLCWRWREAAREACCPVASSTMQAPNSQRSNARSPTHVHCRISSVRSHSCSGSPRPERARLKHGLRSHESHRRSVQTG